MPCPDDLAKFHLLASPPWAQDLIPISLAVVASITLRKRTSSLLLLQSPSPAIPFMVFSCPHNFFRWGEKCVSWLWLSCLTPSFLFLSLFFLQNHFVIEGARFSVWDSFLVWFIPATVWGSAHSAPWKWLSSISPQAPNCTLRGLFQSLFLWDLLALPKLMATSLLECVPSFWLLPTNSTTNSFASVHPRPQHESSFFSQLKKTQNLDSKCRQLTENVGLTSPSKLEINLLIFFYLSSVSSGLFSDKSLKNSCVTLRAQCSEQSWYTWRNKLTASLNRNPQGLFTAP